MPSASCSRHSVPRVHQLATGFRCSLLGPARSRDPASLRACLRASLPGRILPGCVCPRYCSRFPEPAGAAGPCGPVLWRRWLSWQAAAGECGSGRRADSCARCHRPGPRLCPAAAAAPGGWSQHWLPGDGTRAPGDPRGRHRAVALSREGRLIWLWIQRVTLAESLCFGILGLPVCEEGRGCLPGPRWAWKEDPGVGVQHVCYDRSRYFSDRRRCVCESLPSVCDALGSDPSPQHHRRKTPPVGTPSLELGAFSPLSCRSEEGGSQSLE